MSNISLSHYFHMLIQYLFILLSFYSYIIVVQKQFTGIEAQCHVPHAPYEWINTEFIMNAEATAFFRYMKMCPHLYIYLMYISFYWYSIRICILDIFITFVLEHLCTLIYRLVCSIEWHVSSPPNSICQFVQRKLDFLHFLLWSK